MPKLKAYEISNAPKTSVPVVFLHGFGALGVGWQPFQTQIAAYAPTIAFDMPGHGGSLDYPGFGPPKVAARAVLDELNARGIGQAHFVGHSMGGAISSIAGTMAPEKVASLTLLAPGGYGPEFNHPLLTRWAAADTAEELGAIMPEFFGKTFDLPEIAVEIQLAARSIPGATDALLNIAKALAVDGKQGVLPIDDVLAGDYPVSVVWGTDDQVLPVEQGRALEGRVDLHIVEGMGHSPAAEAPDLVKDVILQRLA